MKLSEFMSVVAGSVAAQRSQAEQDTKLQAAIRHLQSEYSTRLSIDKMLDAFALVSKHYEVFLVLSNDLQDAWLARNLSDGGDDEVLLDRVPV
jgi:hypothetical protein